MVKKYKKINSLISKMFLFIFSAIIFSSCSNITSGKKTIVSDSEYVYLNGSYNGTKDNSRAAIPSFNDITFYYGVSASAASQNKVTGTVNALAKTFDIKLKKGSKWTITLSVYSDEEKTKAIYFGEYEYDLTVSVPQETVVININKTSEGTGTFCLPVAVEKNADDTVVADKCEVYWRKNGDTLWPGSSSTVFFSSLSGVEYVSSGNDIDTGLYDVKFEFSKDSSIVGVIYESFVVMNGQETKSWGQSNAAHFNTVDGINCLYFSKSVIQLSQSKYFYVSAGGNDSGSGTAYGSPYKTIQKAVDAICAINDGSTTYNIFLLSDLSSQGTAKETAAGNGKSTVIINPVETLNLNIRPYSGTAVISCDSESRLFEIGEKAQINLSNVTIKSGAPENGAGGAVSNKGTLTINNCKMLSNTSTGNGGAVYSEGKLTVTSTTFDSNTAGSNGGAVCIMNNAADIKSSTFSMNAASVDGGGIYIENSTSAVIKISENSSIKHNTAKSGAGIKASNTKVYLDKTILEENEARVYGGGIYISNKGSLNFLNASDVLIQNNKADSSTENENGFGGGICLLNSDLMATDSSFSILGNTAKNIGGGIAFLDTCTFMTTGSGTIKINDNVIIKNKVTLNGKEYGDGGGGLAFLGTESTSTITTLFSNVDLTGNDTQNGFAGAGYDIFVDSSKGSFVVGENVQFTSIFTNRQVLFNAAFVTGAVLCIPKTAIDTVNTAQVYYKDGIQAFVKGSSLDASVFGSICALYFDIEDKDNYSINADGTLKDNNASSEPDAVDAESLSDVPAAGTVVKVTSEKGLKNIRDICNAATGSRFADVTIKLDSDLHFDINEEFTPIGGYIDGANTFFSGIFDGCGHTIDGLNIKGTTSVGLFGYVKYKGNSVTPSIKNLTVCGKVQGTSQVGGLIGYAMGKAGYVVIIENCISNIEVTGGNGTTGTSHGGLIGQVANYCTIKNCINIGKVNGLNTVGGLIGYTANANVFVYNCANLGDVYGNSGVEGICNNGVSSPCIKNVYNAGIIKATSASGCASIAKEILNSSSESIYSMEGTHENDIASTTASSVVITRISPSEATTTLRMALNNFISSSTGLDDSSYATYNSWQYTYTKDGVNYPLCLKPPVTSNSSDDSTYTSVSSISSYSDISSGAKVSLSEANDIEKVTGWIVNDKCSFSGVTFKLTNDIDFENATFHGFGKAGGTAFQGTLDGGGKTIKNVIITTASSSGSGIGLVNNAGDGCVVQNIVLDNVSFDSTLSGDLNKRGAIIGQTATNSTVTIRNCIVKNFTETNGKNCVGGICGNNNGTIKIINCITSGKITAGTYAGGLVGYNNGMCKIENSASYCEITATSGCAGGLVGSASAPVATSYITNSFFAGTMTVSSTSSRVGPVYYSTFDLSSDSSSYVNVFYLEGCVDSSANTNYKLVEHINDEFLVFTKEGNSYKYDSRDFILTLNEWVSNSGNNEFFTWREDSETGKLEF